MEKGSAHKSDRHDFDEAGRTLRRYAWPDGQRLEPARASKLRGWLRDVGVEKYSLTFVLRVPFFSEVRLQLAGKAAEEFHSEGG